MRKPSILAEAAVLLGLGILAVLVVGQWLGAARRLAPGADTTNACVVNLQRLQVAFTQYAQQNDENFPPMGNAREFQAALLPYVKDPAVFRCPDTGLPYTPNAALSRQSYSLIAGDLDTVPVAQDSAAHADGLSTIVFLDGHVERGGVEYGDPVAIITARERQVALAVIQYTQDNDEIYPPMQSVSALQAAVYPFTHSHRIFNAPNGQPFVPNAALSGVTISSIAAPATTVLLQDTAPYVDGIPTTAYLDGHVERGGFEVEYTDPNVIVTSRAKQLALATEEYIQDYDEVFPSMRTVLEFQAAVAPYLGNNSQNFYNTNGQAFVPNAALSGVNLAFINDPATTLLFQDTTPYTGGTPTTAYADGHVVHLMPFPDAHILWRNPDGRATLWQVHADSSFGISQSYGPYTDGGGTWQAVALATGPNGVNRILWRNPDGRATLWRVYPDGSFGTSQPYGPYTDVGGRWQAVAASVGPDNVAHILWRNPDGRATVWYVNPDGSFGTSPSYGPYTDAGGTWQAVALATGPDNVARILWRNPDGRATLWHVYPDDTTDTSQPYGPYVDGGGLWQATAVSVGPDNVAHILWRNPDGQATLWRVNADSSFSPGPSYGPYTDAGGTWQAVALATGPNGVSRILWRNPDGQATLWQVNPDASFGISPPYGSYKDGGGLWQALCRLGGAMTARGRQHPRARHTPRPFLLSRVARRRGLPPPGSGPAAPRKIVQKLRNIPGAGAVKPLKAEPRSHPDAPPPSPPAFFLIATLPMKEAAP